MLLVSTTTRRFHPRAYTLFSFIFQPKRVISMVFLSDVELRVACHHRSLRTPLWITIRLRLFHAFCCLGLNCQLFRRALPIYLWITIWRGLFPSDLLPGELNCFDIPVGRVGSLSEIWLQLSRRFFSSGVNRRALSVLLSCFWLVPLPEDFIHEPLH